MGQSVELMLTCLCDALYGQVGVATVRVLEAAGCRVSFNEKQTCCGQPPFNAGDWEAARKIARHCKSVLFSDLERPVVSPSGSCTAMIREGFELLFPGEAHLPAFELSEFLVKKMGITSWPPVGEAKPYAVKAAFHRACHGRGLGLRDEQEQLLAGIPGLELVPFAQQEQCCGFGGAFCATQGHLSSGIGQEKLANIQAAGAEEIISGDMGCLMHLDGVIRRQGLNLRVKHFAQVLAEVLP
jgi:L-lactate dehydrogenase complex protein LldE